MTANHVELIDTSRYKCILCLDGKLPDVGFFARCRLPIIAADGAANRLHSLGVSPDIVIGDCDSIEPGLLSQVRHLRITDQSASDFQKALRYIEGQELCPAIICGLSGGYLDHILNNVRIFLEGNCGNIFIDNDVIGFCLHSHQEFCFSVNTKLSFFGMPGSVMSTQGLKWELTGERLLPVGYAFNRTAAPRVTLDVAGSRVLMIVYKNSITDAGAS